MWSVLSRFRHGCRPRCAPSPAALAPAGYVQLITGASVTPPLLVNQDPSVGTFLRDSGLPAAALQVRSQYIPASAPSGIVGGGLFGGGAIGHRVPYHGTLVPVQVGDYQVFEPVPGGDQRK